MSDWGPFSLEGKSAIVTGGAMGIGFAIASRFVEAGASVLIADYDAVHAEAAVKRLTEDSAGLAWMQADVTEAGVGQAVVDRAVEAFGRVDVLVNNAGIYPIASLLEMTPEFFDRVIATNLRGAAFVAQAVARRMIEQGEGGRIVNVVSVDAVHPSMVGFAAYDASKGGLLMLTRSLALELAPHGILVNAIAPGGINTEGVRRMLGVEETAPGAADAPVDGANIPLKRLGHPDEIATVAVFLASPASSYMTGSLIVADGGLLIG